VQQCIYVTMIRDISDLQKCLISTFFDFEQNVIHAAIDQWRDCLRSRVCTGGGQQGCSLGFNVLVSRRSFQTSRSRFGLMETWEGLGLDLVSDRKSCLGLVSVSYYRVSFTGQCAQLFAYCKTAHKSFWMQGVYIVYWFTSLLIYCNASAWDCEWPRRHSWVNWTWRRGRLTPKTVTHPSTHQARCRVTSFMQRTTLTTAPCRQPELHYRPKLWHFEVI